MTEYRLARPGEEEAILDHINLVFSQAHRPHHFDQLLPKVYGKQGFAPLHYVAVTGGNIRAAVALLPLALRLHGESTLNVGFVGSVSVHERARGEGHMKKLMNLMIDAAKEQHMDLLALGGLRQRYGYWDFEKAGCAQRFSVNSANVRHALGDVDCGGMMIRRVKDREDAALPFLYSLYLKQEMVCSRSEEDFLSVTESWQNGLYAIEKAGRAVGYYVGGEREMTELVLADERDLLPLIKAWMAGKEEAVVTVPLHLPARAKAMKAFAEGYSISDDEMIRVLDWPRVLTAALEMKQSYAPLADGSFVFSVQDAGAYRIMVSQGKVTVSGSDAAPEQLFSPRDAVAHFFSPFTALHAQDARMQSWLPLPLYIPSPDCF